MVAASSTLAPLLRNLELYCSLGPAGQAALLSLPFRVTPMDSGACLVREGDKPATCAVLLSGFAYRQKQTVDGVRQIVSLHIPGEPLDLQHLFLGVADHSVYMLTKGEVAMIPQNALEALMLSNPEVVRALTTSILVEASIFREWVLNVGARDGKTRLAHLICEFATRMKAAGLGHDEGYELPFTQDQLATAVGLTSVHVNRCLKVLESDGLIVRGKRNIRIPAWERLQWAAGFSRHYLHLKDMQDLPAR